MASHTRFTVSDHPRMRGEDPFIGAWFYGDGGSPPHARGRRQWGYNLSTTRRITPACAGKTAAKGTHDLRPLDHPRMRGEDYFGLEVVDCRFGSPPHARGRHLDDRVWVRGERITPACAGKTESAGGKPVVKRDHPRMRGEDVVFLLLGMSIPGSPPHARGRRREHLTAVNPPMDHPRMRGEDRTPCSGVLNPLWITPACAGKTYAPAGSTG